jgi:hypothetical protein
MRSCARAQVWLVRSQPSEQWTITDIPFSRADPMNSDASRTALLCLVGRGHEIYLSTTLSRKCLVPYTKFAKQEILYKKIDEICTFLLNMQCNGQSSGSRSALIWLSRIRIRTPRSWKTVALFPLILISDIICTYFSMF